MKKFAFKKTLLTVGFLVLSTCAWAKIPGYYAGLQLGQSYSDLGNGTSTLDSNTVSLSSHDKRGIGARAFVGYDVNPVYGMELGLTRYSNANWNTTQQGTNIRRTKFQAYAIDLLGKFTWHINHAFNVFSKIGPALVRAHYRDYTSNFNLSQNEYFLRPELAFGAAYNMTKNLSINASYSRIFGKGSTGKMLRKNSPSHYMPNLDLASIGFSYAY